MAKVMGALVLTVALAAVTATVSAGGSPQGGRALEFLKEGQCYRIAFSIEGAPNYKILDVLDGGWVKAEVDAGSARAQRQSFWINTAQIVSVREVRCSE